MTLPLFLQAPQQSNTPLHEDTAAYRPLLGRWLIDLALLLGWDRPRRADFIPDLLQEEDFLAVTGLPEVSADDLKETPAAGSVRAQVTRRLKQQRRSLAQTALDPDLPLVQNLNWLAALLGLRPADQAILCFAVFLQSAIIPAEPAFPSFATCWHG